MSEGFYVTNKGIELINSAVPSESKVEIVKAKFGSGGDAVGAWNYDITDVVSQIYEKQLDPLTDKYVVSETDPKALMISVVVPEEETGVINEVGFFDSENNLIVYGVVREANKPAGVKYQYDCWVKFDNVDSANVEIKIVSSEFEKVEKLVADTKQEFDQKIQTIETEFNIDNYLDVNKLETALEPYAKTTTVDALRQEFEKFTGGEEGGGLSEYLKKSEASSLYITKTVANATYAKQADLTTLLETLNTWV